MFRTEGPGRVAVLAIGAIATLALEACSVKVGVEADFDKQAILDAVDSALTIGDCASAVAEITPILNSASSDNDVRLKAASAFACHAKVNFFKLMGDLATDSGSIATGTGLWSTMAKLFPSTAGADSVVEGGLLAIDALQAALTPGALVLPIYQVNAGTYNVGSVFNRDRVSDANIYLTFVSMAALGGLENRYGAPDSTTQIKTKALTWTTFDKMTTASDGCALASTMLNILDAMKSTQSVIGGEIGNSFATVTTILENGYNAACAFGCSGLDETAIDTLVPGFLKMPHTPETGNEGWVATNCAGASVSCTECPSELRDRTKCTGEADRISCAAAGMINFLNAGAYGWN